MFSTEDTIVAIATPPGRGGIGVVRLSGPEAQAIARRLVSHRAPLEPRRATLTYALASASDRSPASASRRLDEIVATFFPEPGSYTGEDVVELSAHGSPVILQAIVEAAVCAGGRLAAPGEFTLRAFLNGRLDLPQAEAVADLVDAVTPLQARAAFDQLQGTATRAVAGLEATLFDLMAKLEASIDFPDEGYHFVEAGELRAALDAIDADLRGLLARGVRGRLIREGRVVAIVGPPNVGKSSLFNALLGSARAIVTPVPGTTRDLVSEIVSLDGLQVTLVDTAGLRETTDAIEIEGISRSRGAAGTADLVIAVHDGTAGDPDSGWLRMPMADTPVLHVCNKADAAGFRCPAGVLSVSALTGCGLEAVREAIAAGITGGEHSVDCPEIMNIRHISLLEQAREAIASARTALADSRGSLSEEFVLADLQRARAALEEMTGRRTSEELLEHIFQHFCIGK